MGRLIPRGTNIFYQSFGNFPDAPTFLWSDVSFELPGCVSNCFFRSAALVLSAGAGCCSPDPPVPVGGPCGGLVGGLVGGRCPRGVSFSRSCRGCLCPKRVFGPRQFAHLAVLADDGARRPRIQQVPFVGAPFAVTRARFGDGVQLQADLEPGWRGGYRCRGGRSRSRIRAGHWCRRSRCRSPWTLHSTRIRRTPRSPRAARSSSRYDRLS